jgi:tRNA dimethylallyltransferase
LAAVGSRGVAVPTVVDFLVGPTASGKTQVGVLVAEALGAEVISLDSMAVYRGMDIGTAKPSPVERARVPFHLIDVCEPTDEFSAGDYLERAAEAVAAIEARGRRVLFVGGTPLYLKLLLEGVFRGPKADWEFRRALRARAQREGAQALHEELTRVDPDAARRLHPNDLRRIERALEVHHLTGRPLSELQRESQVVVPGPKQLVGLRRTRVDLYRRIDGRVERMWATGLVEEVRRLAGRGLSRSASQALGYREVLRSLAGELTLAEARELTQRHSRQFAKRQLTWFRSIPDISWVDVEPEDRPEDVAPRVLVALGGSLNAER